MVRSVGQNHLLTHTRGVFCCRFLPRAAGVWRPAATLCHACSTALILNLKCIEGWEGVLSQPRGSPLEGQGTPTTEDGLPDEITAV